MRGIIHAVGLALALGVLMPAAAKDSRWQARLSTVPIDATMAATVTGHGRAAAELHGRELRITGTFEGLKGAATVAQLHEGAYTGVRGAAIADMTVSQADHGTLSASLKLSPEQVAALRAGHLYIEIHSVSAPDGNLWGWLLP